MFPKALDETIYNDLFRFDQRIDQVKIMDEGYIIGKGMPALIRLFSIVI